MPAAKSWGVLMMLHDAYLEIHWAGFQQTHVAGDEVVLELRAIINLRLIQRNNEFVIFHFVSVKGYCQKLKKIAV